MRYPTDIPSFQAALFAYAPPEENEALVDAVAAAQGQRATPVACADLFRAMKEAPDLDTSGLKLLLGAAHLLAAHGWHNLAGEAVSLIGARVGELPAEEPEPVLE